MTPALNTVPEHIRQARIELAAALEPLGEATRIEVMTAACIETGGSIIPVGRTNWGPHYASVTCLDIHHDGDSLEEAIQFWIKAVYRTETDLARLEDAA